MATRAEYEQVGFGRWKWVEKEFCDRCGRQVIVPWEAHRAEGDKRLFGEYDLLDSGCYTAVYHGQPKIHHFVGALALVNLKSAAELNEAEVESTG